MRKKGFIGLLAGIIAIHFIFGGFIGAGTVHAATLPGPALAQITGHDFTYGAYTGAPYYIGYQDQVTREYHAFVRFNKTASAPAGYKVYLRIKVGNDYGGGPEELAVRGTPIAKVWAYKTMPLPTSVENAHTGWPSMSDVLNTPSKYELLDSVTSGIVAGKLLSFDVTTYFNNASNGMLTFFLTGTESLDGSNVQRYRFDTEPYIEYEQTVVNQAPTVPDYTESVDEDEFVTGNIAGSDNDGDMLTYSVSQQAANGTATVDASTGAWEYSPNANYHGQDVFKVLVSDGNGGTATSTVTITVNPVNDPPVTSDDTATTNKNEKTTGQVTASDVDGDTLTYSISQQGNYGGAAVDPVTGAWEYSPMDGYYGQDVFEIEVSDGNGGIATSTISVTIVNVNVAPTTSDDTATTGEDTSTIGQVTATDMDGDTLTYSVSQQATNGTATVNASTGEWEYAPNANYHGQDVFKIEVSDGNGGTATSTITVTVTPVNDPPVTSDNTATTNKNEKTTGQVTASDVEGDTLTYSISQQAAHGSAAVDPATGAWEYNPMDGYYGQDVFEIEVSDGNGGTATSTISVTVVNINVAPTTSDDTATTDEDTSTTGQVAATDADGDTLTYSVSQQAANGTATVNASTGAWEYAPNANYHGQDVFKIEVSDGNGGTATSTITVTVRPVNDPPTAADDSVTTAEDTSITGQVTANDVDGDTLTYSISQQAAHGIATVNSLTGAWEYAPDANYCGQDVFKIEVSDGNGGTVVSTISVTITPVNDAPELTGITATPFELLDTETVQPFTGVSIEDADPGQTLTVGISLATAAKGEFTTASLQASGFSLVGSQYEASGTADDLTTAIRQLVFAPKANRVAPGTTETVVLTVTVDDGIAVPVVDSQTSLVVTSVNDTPTVSAISNQSISRNSATQALSFTITDPDAEPSDFTVTAESSNTALVPLSGITLAGNGTQRTVTVEPAQGMQGSATITVKVLDSSLAEGTTSFTVAVGNTKPVATAIAPQQIDEDDVLSLTLSGTDEDQDALTFLVDAQAEHAQAVITNGNQLTYTPNQDFNGNDSFTIRAFDGVDESDPVTVQVTVTPVNDRPVAENASYDVESLTSLTQKLHATDVDGDSLTFRLLTTGMKSSSVTIINGDEFIYVPSPGQLGTDSFTYVASDGQEDSDPAVITVNITPYGISELGALSTSTGSLSPAFHKDTLSYEQNVANAVEATTITAEAFDPLATVTINGQSADSPVTVELNVGLNEIPVTVTAADSTKPSRTYLVKVTRAQQSSGSTPSTGTSVQTGTVAAGTGISVYVDGVKQEQTATVQTFTSKQLRYATVTLENDKIIQKLESESNREVTIPYTEAADSVNSLLNGQLLKVMTDKTATLEIQTASASYAFPASLIPVDAIAKELGAQNSLKDIIFSITIAKSAKAESDQVYAAASGQGMEIAASPLEFHITASYGGKQTAVSFFNGYVQMTIPMPEGANANRITTGVVLHSDGQLYHVPTNITTLNGKYYAVINSLTNSTYSIIWHPREMQDLEQHWSRNEVNDLASRMVVQGTSETAFSPDASITRAEFAAIIVRGLGLRPAALQGQSKFSDVQAGSWYAGYVETAAAYGLITGYADGTFGALKTITREEAIAIIARAVAYTKLSASGSLDKLSAFADQNEISSWAKDAMAAAVELQIVTGNSGQLHPQDDITRAEAAALIRRLLLQADLING
ncbi:S-layer homology domain-containing protein [Paenibacillus algorifonticola]|uniref:S-layer homology domain-containing protein n=1 Tax=Paenibacillus algorifonticola TaxID=684063 RepID=A0A1I2GA05_9BACL|nr:Ig-like domain-containing protein [Paenibacillus algorifonticola]SFF13777.1 S-layer homology domain-containing protein [Paenibacillus algorifonticola]